MPILVTVVGRGQVIRGGKRPVHKKCELGSRWAMNAFKRRESAYYLQFI